MRIVFMGTPEFAVPTLEALVNSEHQVVGVITATDKYGGRGGKQLIQSDIKKYALEQGLNILQPKNLKAKSFVDELQALNADIQIVVAFRMLPEVVWNMPPQGTYNLHGSLLPKYRGAAPIHWAVINGETETGVTFFKLKHKIDTGDILLKESTSIDPDETTGDIYIKLMTMGPHVVLKGLSMISKGQYQLIDQDESQVTKAPKIYKENSSIDFNQTSKQVHDFIRGMNPFPGAWTTLDGIECKIYRSQYEVIHHDITPGKIMTDNKSFLRFVTRDGWIDILEIKMSGKRKMDIRSFLNGYDFQ